MDIRLGFYSPKSDLNHDELYLLSYTVKPILPKLLDKAQVSEDLMPSAPDKKTMHRCNKLHQQVAIALCFLLMVPSLALADAGGVTSPQPPDSSDLPLSIWELDCKDDYDGLFFTTAWSLPDDMERIGEQTEMDEFMPIHVELLANGTYRITQDRSLYVPSWSTLVEYWSKSGPERLEIPSVDSLNDRAYRCLTDPFNWDSDSWTTHNYQCEEFTFLEPANPLGSLEVIAGVSLEPGDSSSRTSRWYSDGSFGKFFHHWFVEDEIWNGNASDRLDIQLLNVSRIWDSSISSYHDAAIYENEIVELEPITSTDFHYSEIFDLVNLNQVTLSNKDWLTEIGNPPSLGLEEGNEWRIQFCNHVEQTSGDPYNDPIQRMYGFNWVLTTPTYFDPSWAPPPPVTGCTDEGALNFDSEAVEDDGSCLYPEPEVEGCTDESALNFNIEATVDDGSCEYPPPEVPGCTGENALNFNEFATIDDGSCTYPLPPPPEVEGCTDEDATNFDESATIDDSSCEYPPPPSEIEGCKDESALNHNEEATIDDGTCEYAPPPAPQIDGCTNQEADNFNEEANVDDGSCTFSANISPTPPTPVPPTSEPDTRQTMPTIPAPPTAVAPLAMIFLVGTAFAQAEAYRFPVTRRFWLSMAFLVGATKNVRNGEYQRGRIVGYIAANQGIHLSALVRALGLGNAQAAHHLSVLESQGTIWNCRVGRQIRFYTGDIPEDSTINLPAPKRDFSEDSIPHRILTTLAEAEFGNSRGGYTQSALWQKLECSKQLTSYHVRTLEELGLLYRERYGLSYTVMITPEGLSHLTGIPEYTEEDESKDQEILDFMAAEMAKDLSF